MRMSDYWILPLLLLTAPALRAAEGDCDGVPTTGQCSERVLSYCVDVGTPNEQLVTVDCGGAVFPDDILGICTTISDRYGVDCAVPPGERCLFEDPTGAPVIAFCGGLDPGCVIDEAAGTSQCRASIGPCSPPPEGETFAPLCADDVLVVACQESQPVAVDCVALGGACVSGACVGLPTGSACDEEERLCVRGTTCHPELRQCVDATAACTPASDAPTCDGDTLTYCSVPHDLWQQVDCSAALGADSGMTCGPAFTCVDDGASGACEGLSVGCIGAVDGARCSVEQGFFCGAGLGCVLALAEDDTVEDRCRATADCSFGAAHTGCVGEIATFCIADQALTVAEAAGLDCASLGSRCADDPAAGPICVGEEGARCDDPARVPDSPFRCADQLVCVMESNNLGVCTLPPTVDAGSGDAGTADAGAADRAPDDLGPEDAAREAGPDAGGDSGMDAGRDAGGVTGADATTAAPPDEGCGCRGTAGRLWSSWSAALLCGALALTIWRRRR